MLALLSVRCEQRGVTPHLLQAKFPLLSRDAITRYSLKLHHASELLIASWFLPMEGHATVTSAGGRES